MTEEPNSSSRSGCYVENNIAELYTMRKCESKQSNHFLIFTARQFHILTAQAIKEMTLDKCVRVLDLT